MCVYVCICVCVCDVRYKFNRLKWYHSIIPSVDEGRSSVLLNNSCKCSASTQYPVVVVVECGSLNRPALARDRYVSASSLRK
jgi:hypothetical protein